MEHFIQWVEQSWVILVAVIGGVTLIWNFLNKTVKEIKKEVTKPLNDINTRFDSIEANNKNMSNALLTMQRKSLLDSCEKYIKLGYADLQQKEVLMAQFESYKQLGGNSFIHKLVEQVNALPLEPQKKKTLNE